MSDKLKLLSIKQGVFHAYFIYDVADSINLVTLQKMLGKVEQAPLNLRSVTTPGYIQFSSPPLVVTLPGIIVDEYEAACCVKLYDYGTVSVKLSFKFSGPWEKFDELSRQLRQSERLNTPVKQALEDVLQEVGGSLNKPHKPLIEEYYILEIGAFDQKVSAHDLMNNYKIELACLVLGESGPLTIWEQEEALKVYFSYFETDLVIVHWDGAFIFEERESAEAVEGILEFANTQLVELRTYDAQLDAQLDEIYSWDLAKMEPHWLFGRSVVDRRTKRLRSLLVDVRELCDRTNNALKIIGDAFYARLYRGASQRFRLLDWQQQIESKLSSIAEIYRFAIDQAQYVRSEFLEVVIIILIVVEIGIALLGIRR